MHLAHELSGIVERKVVQYLRCNHEIESAGGEGEGQGIAGNSGYWIFTGSLHEFHATVEPEYVERYSARTRESSQPIGDVAGAGTDIEQGRAVAFLPEPRGQFRLHRVNAAEQPVRQRDVAVRSTLERRIAIDVEPLHSSPARRREHRQRQRSSSAYPPR
jgi:hypothetical protein